MGATRRGRWRTGVLILVHLLIFAHIVQWLITGSTISPVEPSESMKTLELGLVNAGFIMFALAILSTLIFGRFFCGWLCHVVALQDACAWLMNRIGIRPKQFRSRLLVFAPLVLGFYMFIWPNFKRFAIAPLLERADIAWPAWLRPVAARAEWKNEMVVTDFWATFPDWYIAIPFLLVCGFVTVYFLGAKGFCTYACPYGGIFRPVDRIAPVRIKVTDACIQCGHCTSVCTSNVRVSEEVHDFGMVVDPGCMKCMDCVEACPSDALYLGLGGPALGKKPRNKESRQRSKSKAQRRYDMTWPEEIAGAVIFIGAFLATRGMLEQVPMLLAGGAAAIVTFLVMTAWWVLVRPNARLSGLTLKQKGRVRFAGVALVLVTAVLIGLVTWGGQARYPRWRADIAYAQAIIPAGFVIRPEYAPGPVSKERAENAARWLARADSVKDGGHGWRLNAEHRTREAYFLAVLGRLDEAAASLERVIDEGTPGDALITQLIRLRQQTGATPEQIRDLQRHALNMHPELHHLRLNLAMQAAQAGDPKAGDAMFTIDDEDLAGSIGFRMAHISYLLNRGLPDEARAKLDEAIPVAEADRNAGAGWLADGAGVANRLGDVALATSLLERALTARGRHPGVFFAAAEIAAMNGDGAGAIDHIEAGLASRGGDTPVALSRAANLLLRLDRVDRGADLYRRAAEGSTQPFERVQLGQALVLAGMNAGRPALIDDGLGIMQRTADDTAEPLIYHDLAVTLFQVGRAGPATEAIIRAAELGPDSVLLAQRAGELAAMAGDTERAEYWRQAAEARRSAAP
jgi:polyferredoxin/thioredoxin-like negative regulator of GroEL